MDDVFQVGLKSDVWERGHNFVEGVEEADRSVVAGISGGALFEECDHVGKLEFNWDLGSGEHGVNEGDKMRACFLGEVFPTFVRNLVGSRGFARFEFVEDGVDIVDGTGRRIPDEVVRKQGGIGDVMFLA
jgi:hypothetical protein